MLKSMESVNKGRMFLTPKPDHTSTLRTGDLPSASYAKGTWSQKGNLVTLKDTKTDEVPPLTLSAGGKTMFAVYPNGLGRLTFSR